MVGRGYSPEDGNVVEQVLGYLNFSSGVEDPHFLKNLNRLFELAGGATPAEAVWRVVCRQLESELAALTAHSAAFHNAEQAASVLRLVREGVIPGYFEFHRDLLFHQSEASLVNAFFLGRIFEAVLRQGPPWDETGRIIPAAIRDLNDFLGHRPVAALESQKIEPYAHEWVRPVPLYIRDAGVVTGPYQRVVEATLELLRATDAQLLREAFFDPELLDELAFDPRAYDFDHPANKRPNYHFGQWDPHHIDNRGFYRRYVIRQVTLDALMKRAQTEQGLAADELLFEAAAVMAGTIIMSTGVSGAGPETHDSTVTLSTLLPRIAAYRDQFYEQLLGRLEGEHGQRLRQEAERRRQPFGGARQHLNAELARRRAAQLEHVHLAAIYARLGFSEAAAQEADVVPAASARMWCQIENRLTACDLALAASDLERASELLEEIHVWILRGIACGAIVDPWNILGFDANFSLFPAVENSVHDHRVDELVALMEQVFALQARLWSETATRDDQTLAYRVSSHFRAVVDWWRKYAAHEVSSVEAIDPEEAYQAAQCVAEALHLWHKGGAAVEDVRFWAPYADMFDSPKAYALVVHALLERDDFVASMALTMHWLQRADEIGLEQGDTSFFDVAERWMAGLRRKIRSADQANGAVAWPLARKFLDYLEANGEEYWRPPAFDLGAVPTRRKRRGPGANGTDAGLDAFGGELEGELDEELDEELDDAFDEDLEEAIYEAAYDDMVYRDSTDDGIDASLADSAFGAPSDDELMAESRRLGLRLSFISSVARLWQLAASFALAEDQRGDEFREVISRWIQQAADNLARLRELLNAIGDFPLPASSGDHDSMVEYDRVRLIKESILEQGIATSVDVSDAVRILAASAYDGAHDLQAASGALELGDDVARATAVFSGILRGNRAAIRQRWRGLLQALSRHTLLYVPLVKGGDPHEIVAARTRQRLIQDLLGWLPRLGLIVETCQVVELAREMERQHPVGPGAVTEFDEMFKMGYKSLVRMIVHSAASWTAGHRAPTGEETGPRIVVECLKQLTESLLSSWLAHSRTLRLSVLEKVKNPREWTRLVVFVETYGADLFTQRFLNLANLRAILHQGAEAWLMQLAEEPEPEVGEHLLEDLESGQISVDDAADVLSVILEAVVENYGEYRDYNSMTTQSDRGELLYMLLDFLRLRTEYDRICWQLKPVVWAHEILVRARQTQAAEMWRRELAEQTSREAASFLKKLAKLQTQYAMRMPTVADRLGERFIRPMVIDRIRALVQPAMEEAHADHPGVNFALLRKEIELLTREPTGVGLDVPAWLMALEGEVATVAQGDPEAAPTTPWEVVIPQITLSLEETQRQLEKWSARR
jgi:hypothetical protein